VRHLPLYEAPPPSAVLAANAARGMNPHCTRCELHRGAPAVCAGPEVVVQPPAGVQVRRTVYALVDMPLRDDDPAAGSVRATLRTLLLPHLGDDTRLVVDTAVRCAPPALVPLLGAVSDPPPKALTACRPYLRAALDPYLGAELLVLAFGDAAVAALLGDGAPPAESRGAYHYLYAPAVQGPHRPRGLVWILRDLREVVRNRFLREQLADDVRLACTTRPAQPPLDAVAHVVETRADALEAVAACYASDGVGWDTETFGRPFDTGFRTLMHVLAPWREDLEPVDVYTWDEAALARPDVVEPLAALLADPDVLKVCMNGKYDVVATSASALGVRVQGVGAAEIGLACSTVHTGVRTALAVQQARVGMWGGKAVLDKALERAVVGVRAQADARDRGAATLFDDAMALPKGINTAHVRERPLAYAYAYVDRTLLTRYAALDGLSTVRVWPVRRAELRQRAPLQHVWDELVRDTTPAVAQMEAWGVRVHREAVLALQTFLAMRLDAVRARLAAAGLMEPGSPAQVAHLLFTRLKLPVLGRTRTGQPRTDSDVLEMLELRHPVVADLMEWRRLDKLRGTYCEGLLRQITADGRVHVDFRIDGARTGRMSAGGGLHGIPRPDTEEAALVRNVFCAEPGWELWELDLSQAELRVLGGLARDPKMVGTFVAGVDIHKRTAEWIAPRVWRIDPAQVSKVHRSVAKVINLAMAYGRGDAALADEITRRSGMQCDRDGAREIRAAVMGEFDVAMAWMDEQRQHAARTGYARTWLNGEVARLRFIPELGMLGDDDEARALRAHGSRAAGNTPVQGTTGDIVLLAVVRVVRWIITSGVRARLVLTVHDSLLLEVHPDDAPRVVRTVKRIMEEHDVGCPLVADAKRGTTWGAMVEAHVDP